MKLTYCGVRTPTGWENKITNHSNLLSNPVNEQADLRVDVQGKEVMRLHQLA